MSAEEFFKKECETQQKSSKGFLSDPGTLPKIPYSVYSAIFDVMEKYGTMRAHAAIREAAEVARTKDLDTKLTASDPDSWITVIDKSSILKLLDKY